MQKKVKQTDPSPNPGLKIWHTKRWYRVTMENIARALPEPSQSCPCITQTDSKLPVLYPNRIKSPRALPNSSLQGANYSNKISIEYSNQNQFSSRINIKLLTWSSTIKKRTQWCTENERTRQWHYDKYVIYHYKIFYQYEILIFKNHYQ